MVCDPNCGACIDGGAACDGPDICDGIDNDCDRRIDEDFVSRGVKCGQGICERDGMTECRNGMPVSVCTSGLPQAGPDGCGGGDTDCDGDVDENCLRCARAIDGRCLDTCPGGFTCNDECSACELLIRLP